MGVGWGIFLKNETCKYHTLFQFCTKETEVLGEHPITNNTLMVSRCLCKGLNTSGYIETEAVAGLAQ